VLWWQSLASSMVGGDRILSEGLMDVVFRRVFSQEGRPSPNILSWWLGGVTGFGLGRIIGVRIFLLGKSFLFFTLVAHIEMLTLTHS
jgi:hypothetical protein